MAEKSKQSVLKTILDKVKMVGSGMKREECCDVPISCSSDKTRYPCLFLTSKEASVLVGRDVGDEVTLVVKAAVVGRRVNVMKDQEKNENFDLEIHEIGLAGSEKEEKE